jgi:nitrate/nitrite transport system substrate-binding protein
MFLKWCKKVAADVYRPDLYAVAAKALIESGEADAKDFPNFDTETGFKPPQPDFIDDVIFDGSKPTEYINSFNIGLKADQVL